MLERIWKVFAVAAFALIAASCRTGTGASQASSEDAPATRGIVIVYMGGFNSCGNNSPRGLAALSQFERVRAEVTSKGVPVRWLISCYNGMSSTYIQWESSAEPTKVYSQHWQKPDQAGQIFDEVKSLSQDFTWPVYVIGHSYGGWLSSNLVAAIAYSHPDRSRLVTALFTVDPISPYHCNQASYAATIAKWTSPASAMIAVFTAPGGCEQAPWQYNHADNQNYPGNIFNAKDGQISSLIARATENWHLFYQTRDYLHSSLVGGAAAPTNSLVNYGAFVAATSSSPHVKIHLESAVWEAFRSTILDNDVTYGEYTGSSGGDFLQLADGSSTLVAPVPSLGPELTAQQAVALTTLAGKENDGTKVEFAPITPEQEKKLNGIFGDVGGENAKPQ